MGRVARTGRFQNVADVRTANAGGLFSATPVGDLGGTGVEPRSVLCVPVYGHCGATGHCDKVIALLVAINKTARGGRVACFTEGDEDALAALGAHISTSMSFADGDEHGFDETIERCAGALRAKGSRINAAQTQRVHDLYTAVLGEVCGLLGADFAQLHSVDVPAGEFRCLATSADSVQRQAHGAGSPHQLSGSGPVEDAVAKGSPMTADDGTVSATLCCPVFDTHGSVIGVVRVVGDSGRGFDPAAVRQLQKACVGLASTMEAPGSRLAHVLHFLKASASK